MSSTTPLDTIFPSLFTVCPAFTAVFPKLAIIPFVLSSLSAFRFIPVVCSLFSSFLSSLLSSFTFSSTCHSFACSFVIPSDSMYPFTFDVSFTFISILLLLLISPLLLLSLFPVTSIFPLLLINPDKLFNFSPTIFTLSAPDISPLILLVSFIIPSIFSFDSSCPLSFISLSVLSFFIFPFIIPFLLSIIFPFKVKAPMESIFPLLFPFIFPPMLISLPLITPCVLSNVPVMFIPISLFFVFSLFCCSLFSSSFLTSSFVSPSDSMYPFTFDVSFTFISILLLLLISPLLLLSLFPVTSIFSVASISPVFLVSFDFISTLPFASIFDVILVFSLSISIAFSPRAFSRYPVTIFASISVSFAFTCTFFPAVVSPFILTFFVLLYVTCFPAFTLFVVISPFAVSVMSSTLTRSPFVFTPAPLSFEIMSIFPAYILPAAFPSTAIPLYVSPLLFTSFVLYSYVCPPADTSTLVSFDAFITPAISIVFPKSSRSVRLNASTPFSPIPICPCDTSIATRSPSFICKLPVVSVTLSVFKKPPPFTYIPFLFAITRSALCPATSTIPFIFVLFFPVTSVMMRFAATPLSRFLFLATSPAVCVFTTTCLLLFSISPCSLTCNSLREL